MAEDRDLLLHPASSQRTEYRRTREGTMVINIGPQHPSTHGVLRIVVELDGETIVSSRPVIGYLHTGIEKNTEVRTWQQGVAFVTRMDYLANFHNEVAYCLAAERLLGIEAPPRAQVIRVIGMELQRVASHLVWIATTALELGAVSMMLYGFRERERILQIFEAITGLRMNMAYTRVGGFAVDLPPDGVERIRAVLRELPGRIDEYEDLLSKNPIWLERNQGIGHLPAERALELGVTGPLLRAAGVSYDLRKVEPYLGYEGYDFEVPVRQEADCYARYLVRMAEMRESLKIVEQALDRLPGGPVMIDDPRLAWPAKLEVGPDGIGNSEEYVRYIMEESMEALINHFKLVTEGFKVPAGEVYQTLESPRGEMGYYVVSDGSTRPYRVSVRDPSFVNLQALPVMVEGLLIADLIACIATIDPVMGGVDR